MMGEVFSMVFMVVYFVVVYVFGVMGYLRLAKHTGYKYKVIAFIPMIRVMILNNIMEVRVGKALRGRLNLLTVVMPLVTCFVFTLLGIMAIGIGVIYGELGGLLLLGLVLLMLAWMFMAYLFYGAFLVVVYGFYKEFFEERHVVWFVLTLVVGNIVHSISLLRVSEEKLVEAVGGGVVDIEEEIEE